MLAEESDQFGTLEQTLESTGHLLHWGLDRPVDRRMPAMCRSTSSQQCSETSPHPFSWKMNALKNS